MVGADNDSRNDVHCFRSSASAQHRSNFPIELFSSIIPCATMSGRNSDYKRTAWFHHADHHHRRTVHDSPFFSRSALRCIRMQCIFAYTMYAGKWFHSRNDIPQMDECTFYPSMLHDHRHHPPRKTLPTSLCRHFIPPPLMHKVIVHHFDLSLNHQLHPPLIHCFVFK